MSQQHVATLKRAFEAVARGDFATAAATADPNVHWNGVGELVPAGGDHRGADVVVTQVFETIPDAYEEFRAEPEEFLDADEHVVALGTFTGRPEGSERAISTPFAGVAEFRDGRIARMRWFTDTAEWLYAMPEAPDAAAGAFQGNP